MKLDGAWLGLLCVVAAAFVGAGRLVGSVALGLAGLILVIAAVVATEKP